MAIWRGGIYSPDKTKKKTRQGMGLRTKWGNPGPNGGNKNYKKKYRGQGKKWTIRFGSMVIVGHHQKII